MGLSNDRSFQVAPFNWPDICLVRLNWTCRIGECWIDWGEWVLACDCGGNERCNTFRGDCWADSGSVWPQPLLTLLHRSSYFFDIFVQTFTDQSQIPDNKQGPICKLLTPFSGGIPGKARNQLHGRLGDRWRQLPAVLSTSSSIPAVHTWAVRLR